MDGKVTISTELDNSSIPKGLEAVKGQFGGLKNTLSQVEKAISTAFSKPLALAQAKVEDLERQYASVTAQLNDAKRSDNDTLAQSLGLRQIAIYNKLAAARTRLAIEVQAAAQMQSTAETKAAVKQESKLSAVLSRIKSLASGVGSAISKSFSGVKNAMSGFAKIARKIKDSFSSLSKSSSTFSTRLKSIVSGALLFNLISTGLRKVVDYFGRAITSTTEMKAAMASLRAAAESAAAPIIQILTPALSALANAAATVLSYLGKIITLFTGTVSSAAKQAIAAGGAAKKAAKSLAGFDEITKLDDAKEGGGGGASSSAGTAPEVTVPDWAQVVVENLKAGEWGEAAKLLTEKVNSVFDSVDWNAVGAKLGNGVSKALDFISGTVSTFDWDGAGKSVASTFMGMWNSIDPKKVAQTFSDSVIGAISSIGTTIKNIEWQKIGNDISTFIANINWGGLASSLANGIGAALGGLAAFLWGLIEDAWNDVVKWWYKTAFDSGEFTMEGLLKGIWQAIKDIGKWIYDKIFKPFIDGFREAFKINSPSKVMEEEGGYVIAGLLNGITNAWKSITQFFDNAVSWFQNVFTNIAKFASNSWQSIRDAWSVVADWFTKTIINPLTNAFTNFWSNLKNWATQAWSGITGVFGSAGQWFGKTFGDAWEKVKKVFSTGGKVFDGIKEGIVSSFKSIVNSLISGINRVITRPFEGLNTAIRKIRSVNVLGLYPFSGLSTVSVPKIPYLAQGAVLPANKPFMAVVGDQRHGTNVEAPLTTIQEAVANVMGDQVAAMMAGFNALLAENQRLREVVENVNLGDTTIGQAADRYNQKLAIMRGG